MIKGTYPKSLYEALAVHTFLEELGYSKATEIFFGLNQKDVCVRVNADGRECYLRIGAAELPPDEMFKKWLELVAEWNTGGTMTREDKNKIYLSSKVYSNKGRTVFALAGAGFTRFLEGKGTDLN